MDNNKGKYLEIRNNFYKAYNSEILPILLSMENIRKQCFMKGILLKLLIIIPVVFIVIPLVFWYCFGRYEQFSEYGDYHFVSVLFGCLCFLGFSILIFIFQFSGEVFYNIQKNFQKELKSHCLSMVLRSLGDIEKSIYTHEDKSMLEKSGLGFFSSSEASNVKCDDCFRGEYNGVEFKLLELSSFEKNFGRLIISFASNKRIKAPVIIGPECLLPRTSTDKQCSLLSFALGIELIALIPLIPFYSGLYTLYQDRLAFENSELLTISFILVLVVMFLLCCMGFTIYKIIHALVASDVEQIKLEDKTLKVYSEDDVEARYLITPAFIERFNNLRKAYSSSIVRCAFFENRIMFEIVKEKDCFELGSIWSPMDKTYFIDDFCNEIIAIYEMIDYFKLYEKTGL